MEAAIGAAHWVVSRALSPVTDGLLESWTASSELGPNVRELKMELLYAEGMLNNARGRDLHNRALKQLLLELRNVAYNADDVLDELEYFRIRDELDGTFETIDNQGQGLVGGLVLNTRHTARAVTKCLCGGCSCSGARTHDNDDHHHDDDQEAGRGCMDKVISSARNTAQAVGKRIPCPSLPRNWCKAHQREHVVPAPKLKFNRVEISQRMRDIVEQLKPLCAKVATILELEIFGSHHTMAHSLADDRPKTTPEIIEFKLYGRDNLKKNLVDDITHGKYCANDLTVVSIVGPGGMGKTTFTQHIYQEVSNHHFQVLVWTCVSQNFNATRLAQEIVKKIPKSDNKEDNASDEELIRIRLQSKKFLLVLDDVWTYHEDEWKKLLAPFKKVGTTGNVVIVTTRIPKVANMVATVGCLIRLERLEDNDCIAFFKACIFGDQQSRKKHADLDNLADEIVKNLKGFPLAVKTVGRLLRNKLTVEHWRRVLESKEWELHSGDDDIMPALKLSYNYLSFDLQQCFSHCALFPEDYEFGREELIHLWIGLGLLDNCEQNNRMEDVGSDCLDALIDHGFFQKSENQYTHPRYVLHDLLHELAVSVSANECLSIHGSDVRSIQVPTSICHLSISIDYTHVKDRMTFENFKTDLSILGKKLKVENLRTLMLFGQYPSFSKTLSGLFRKAKSLRVILLSEVSYDVEDLLHNFSQLIHLCYFRIIGKFDSEISLPSSIPKCYHLLVLDIEHCRCDSSSLRREMRSLGKLRHFVLVDHFYSPIYSPIFEVGKLKSLQKLNCFEVKRETNGFELKQLGQLQQLQGSLDIYNLERVQDVKEAEEAKLVHMNHLHGLRLYWEASQSIKETKQGEDILESLKPHNYLREISITGHRGTSCPSWLGENLSISNLEFLHLNNVAWTKFPPMGELCTTNEHGEECISYITGQRFLNLKRVELYSLPRLKRWRGNDNSQLFSYLEKLTVSSCSELEELPISHCTSRQAKQRFPKLQEIDISDCPNLLSLPPIPWTIDLLKANIYQVGTCVDIGYDKDECYITGMGNVDLDSEVWNRLCFHNLHQIEKLSISECPPMPLEHMQMLASLRTLHISKCTKVLWSVEGDNNAQCQIPVESLNIIDCDASGKELTQLMCYFSKLRSLSFGRCNMIKELGVVEKHTTAKQAQLLSTSACKTEGAHAGRQGQQTRGEEIEIEAVDEGGLLLIPRELLRLEISECPDLRLDEKGLQGLRSLTSLNISNCPKFFASSATSAYSPFPASLQSLTVSCCTDLTIEGLWELFSQGCLTELKVYGSLKFFTCTDTEPSQLNQQDLPHHFRSCELRTNEIAGALAQPICARLSPFLTKLVFSGNNYMERFTEEQEAALQILTSIQELQIVACSKLQSLPAGLSGLPSLKKLEIEFLDSVQSIPKDGLPSSLKELRIELCPAIRSIPKGTLPSSLQTLEIRHCSGIQSLPKGTLPSSLQTLEISYCSGIQSLPKGTLPNSLQNLIIIRCPGIQSLPKDGFPDSLRVLYVTESTEELRRQCRKLKGTIPIVIA